MKNNLKKTIKLFYSGVFVLILLTVFSSSAMPPKVNFSGIWKVDTLKSNYGGFGPAAAAVTLKIVQAKDTISIERTINPGGGVARSFTDKLPLDGKPMTNTKGTTKSSLSIKWFGQALVETSSYHDDKFNKTYQATETWTLSADGKTLTIDRVVANDGEGGHGASKAVYNRV